MKKYLFVILINFFCQLIISQNNKSSFGLEFGYFNTDMTDINYALYPFFDNITYSIGRKVEFDNDGQIERIKQYSIIPTIGLTYSSKSFLKDKFSIDVSIKYYYFKKQEIVIDSFYSGIIRPIDLNANNWFQTDEYTDYNYGFKLNLISFSIVSNFNLIRFKGFNIDIGIGLINTFCILKQNGILVTGPILEFQETQVKTNAFNTGLISTCKFSYGLTEKIKLKFMFSYSFQNRIDVYKKSLYNRSDGFTEKQYIVPLDDTKKVIPRLNLKGIYFDIGFDYVL